MIGSIADETNMSVLLIIGPKCTLAVSHATLVCHSRRDRQTDGQTDGRGQCNETGR